MRLIDYKNHLKENKHARTIFMLSFAEYGDMCCKECEVDGLLTMADLIEIAHLICDALDLTPEMLKELVADMTDTAGETP